MLFSNANPMVYFLSLRRVSPIKRLSGRAVSLLHLNGECLGYCQYKKPQKTPPPISCAVKRKYIVFYLHVLAVGSFTLLISFQALRSFRNTHSLRFLTLHSAFVHFTHLSTTRHKWLLHSTPQIHAVIPFRLSAVIHTRIYPHTNSQ